MIGHSLAQHRITAAIGAGGMGEVFRARDGKLDRDVAIKVLPAAFTAHAERLVRFEREAKLLASLNHTNIAHVYGFESATLDVASDGARILVVTIPAANRPRQIEIVTDWTSELLHLAPRVAP